jgi:hypothetical protein
MKRQILDEENAAELSSKVQDIREGSIKLRLLRFESRPNVYTDVYEFEIIHTSHQEFDSELEYATT